MLKTLIIFTLSLSLVSAQLHVRAFLNSSYLIPGEITSFVLETNSPIDGEITLPDNDQFTLKYRGNKPVRGGDTGTLYQYFFELSSLSVGNHTVPPITLPLSKGQYQSAPIDFVVFPSSKLTYQTVQIGSREIRYATALLLPERDLYLGETVPAEIKVYLPYLPRFYSVIEFGLPELKRDGVSAWRFQAPKTRLLRDTPFLMPQGPSFAITYRSSAHAMRSGQVKLGDGNVRPVFRAVQATRGQSEWVDLPIYLPVTGITRQALPLPEGAPASYQGAVGQFDLSVAIDGKASTDDSAPLNVKLQVSGTGNLDKIAAPLLVDPGENWKQYPATRTQRESERRFLSGNVEFHQLLRPKSAVSQLPPFEFTYFDPQEVAFKTLKSASIPLTVKTSLADRAAQQRNKEAPPQAEAQPTTPPSQRPARLPALDAAIPQENMADVLDLKANPTLERRDPPTQYWQLWHLIPALVTLLLALKAFRIHLQPKIMPSPPKREALRHLKSLKNTADPLAFLKKAAHHCQLYLASNEKNAPLVEEVESLRDSLCFSPQAQQNSIPGETRQSLLKRMQQATQKLSLVLILSSLGLLFVQPLYAVTEGRAELCQAAQQYAQEGDYGAAIATYFNAYPDLAFPADILYNIGTCYAKKEEPGQAMLYYRRALLLEPDHAEAQQNLRYLERINGSIVIRRKGLYQALSYIPLPVLKNAAYCFGWGFVIALLITLTAQQSRYRTGAWFFVFSATFCIPLILTALFLYPNDGKFCPTHKLAVVTSPTPVTALTSATYEGQQVIIAPPGSTAKILHQRGLWAYLEFSDSTRGWLDTQFISMLTPESQLVEIPTIEQKSDL